MAGDAELLDKFLNKFDEAAKNWGAVQSDENVPNRTLLRVRDRYYKARKELFDYTHALSRTVVELDARDRTSNNG